MLFTTHMEISRKIIDSCMLLFLSAYCRRVISHSHDRYRRFFLTLPAPPIHSRSYTSMLSSLEGLLFNATSPARPILLKPKPSPPSLGFPKSFREFSLLYERNVDSQTSSFVGGRLGGRTSTACLNRYPSAAVCPDSIH